MGTDDVKVCANCEFDYKNHVQTPKECETCEDFDKWQPDAEEMEFNSKQLRHLKKNKRFEYKITPTIRQFTILAVSRFGDDHQLNKVIEELGELIQAISKYRNKENNRDNLIEEIVDVEIMLDQLKYIAMIDTSLLDMRHNRKIEQKLVEWKL